jgi:hypothetical protein
MEASNKNITKHMSIKQIKHIHLPYRHTKGVQWFLLSTGKSSVKRVSVSKLLNKHKLYPRSSWLQLPGSKHMSLGLGKCFDFLNSLEL